MIEIVESFITGILEWTVDNLYEAGFGLALFVLGIVIPLILRLPQKASLFLLRKLSTRRRRLRYALRMFGGSVELIDKHKLAHLASPQRIRHFYDGGMLSWDIVAAGADIKRDKQSKLMHVLRTEEQGLRLFCIVGEPGAGKSTMIWRVGADLVLKYHALVLRVVQGNDPQIWFHLSEFCREVGQPCYIIADDLFRDDEVVETVCSLDPSLPVTVLASSQLSEYRGSRMTVEPVTIPLGAPSEQEKTRTLEKLGKQREDMDREQIMRLERASEFRVMMMELTSGRDHVEAINAMIKNLERVDPVAYNGYKYICFCSQYEVAIPISILDKIPPR